jgi:signal transduction histidine kinase
MNKSNKASILVVDDDSSVLKATTNLLESYGYQVFSSSNVNDAVDSLQTNDIDVVVTDIVMPHISGIKLLQKVHDTAHDIPVILITAYLDPEKMIEAIKFGAFDFIIKPMNIDLFIHSIEKALNYKRMQQIEEDYKHLLEEYNQEIEALVSERTMGLMALSIADKIRNPATVIGLTSKRLLEKEMEPEKFREKLNNIVTEAEKLDNIVKTFESLMQSKKFIFRFEYINAHLENIISINKGHADAKGIEIVFNPSQHSLRVNIQKNLFQIAISHILKNAIDATPRGGRVTISTNEDGNNVLLRISDTGSGIDKEIIDKIFDPMFSTNDQKFGMGLSLVKQIIKEHMGKINVESKLGEGTTFSITFPIRWTEDQ